MEINKNIILKFFSWLGIWALIFLIGSVFYYGLKTDNSNWVNVGVTVVLVAITAYYAYYTKILVNNTESQNPVIGIKILDFHIFPEMKNGRRQLSIIYSLENIGNAPAIEIFVDSEIQLPKGNIEGENVIPARFKPDFFPYLKPNETIPEKKGELSQIYGNKLIHQLLIDYIGEDYTHYEPDLTSPRIWMGDDELRKYKASVTLYVYYRNSFSQYFESMLKVYIHVYKNTEKYDDYKVNQLNLNGQLFNSKLISNEIMKREMNYRNQKRELCGW